MIPKIIHFCWLSDDDYPESIKKCLASWHKYLPDYEIRLWDLKRFDINSTLWTKQAFETKKYAFAADYIRLYALYHEGGIYLDSDVLVFKSFNDLLDLPYFIGEDYVHSFEPAIIGCEPGMPWIKQVLDRYEGRSFIKEDGSLDMYGLPLVFHDRLCNNYQFRLLAKMETYKIDENVINIFPSDFFNSRDYVGSKKYANSYCTHNYAGSWLQEPSKVKLFIKKLSPRILGNFYYSILFNFIYKDSLKEKQIHYI